MTSPEKQNLDRMLSAHLQKSLNSQRGKAKDAFQNLLRQQQQTAPKPYRKLWLWAGLPSALAASLAISITAFSLRNPGDSPTPIPSNNITAAASLTPVVDQETVTRSLDAGTGLLADDTPVKLIRQQTLQRTQWIDPSDRATYSVTQPIEKVGYVKIQPY